MSDPRQRDLAGRVVMVTGASRGLGRAVFTACAAAGATVLACGRDVTALEVLADGIEARGEPAPVIVPVNLEAAGADDYRMIAGLVDSRFGRLDGLVVNAAMLGELAPLATYDPLTWARVFQVNLHSPFMLLQEALPLLESAPDGAVIFTLAPEGERAAAHWGAYAASKAALANMMQVLADEYAAHPRLRVHAVRPGPMRTRLRTAAYPAADPGQWPAPETVAPLYVELLGAHGRAWRGEVLEPARQE